MPFEPLRTDERTGTPPPPKRDFDDEMLVGCGTFVLTSVIGYGLGASPFFVFTNTHQLKGLALATGLGLVCQSALGGFASRKYELPGSCGYLAGAFVTTVFIHLRLQQLVAGRGDVNYVQPEFPDSWMWFVPGAWLAIAIAVVLFCYRSLPEPSEPSKPPSQ